MKKVLGAFSRFVRPIMKLYAVKFRRILEVLQLQGSGWNFWVLAVNYVVVVFSPTIHSWWVRNVCCLRYFVANQHTVKSVILQTVHHKPLSGLAARCETNLRERGQTK